MSRAFPVEEEVVIGEALLSKDDRLNRADFGKSLSDMVLRVERPLVIVLNGDWGTGKTFFLKRWVGSHAHDYPDTSHVIYFDAFQHDYLDDPLSGLISTLIAKEGGKPLDPVRVGKLKEKAFKVLRPLVKIGMAALTAGASTLVDGVAEEVVRAAQGEANNSVDAFWQREVNRAQAMEDFKSALSALTKPSSETEKATKIVFIIDELDRCRPDFALSLLEVIKHFFSVPNVHFVLGANLTALEAAVASRYGRDIDAERYLSKFFNVVTGFPKLQDFSAVERIVDSTFAEFGLDSEVKDDILSFLRIEGVGVRFSIRSAKYVMTRVALCRSGLRALNWPIRVSVLLAIFLEATNRQLYENFRGGSATASEVRAWFRLGDPNEASSTFDECLWVAVDVLCNFEPSRKTNDLLSKGHFRVGVNRKGWMQYISQCLDTFHVA